MSRSGYIPAARACVLLVSGRRCRRVAGHKPPCTIDQQAQADAEQAAFVAAQMKAKKDTAAKLFADGVHPTRVARRLGVSAAKAWRWKHELEATP